MNEGVKILLERIKTNPEEFYDPKNGLHVSTKWGRIIADYQGFLDEEDKKALNDALSKMHQQAFTERVMKELLAPEEEDGSLGKQWYQAQNATRLGGATPVRSSTLQSNGTNAVWANRTSLSQDVLDAQTYQMEQMRLHLDAHRHAMKAEEADQLKKHQTLFGKLKNYLHSDE